MGIGLAIAGTLGAVGSVVGTGVPLPFTMFELADAAYKGWLGVQ